MGLNPESKKNPAELQTRPWWDTAVRHCPLCYSKSVVRISRSDPRLPLFSIRGARVCSECKVLYIQAPGVGVRIVVVLLMSFGIGSSLFYWIIPGVTRIASGTSSFLSVFNLCLGTIAAIWSLNAIRLAIKSRRVEIIREEG
jgi:hypothetical protein